MESPQRKAPKTAAERIWALQCATKLLLAENILLQLINPCSNCAVAFFLATSLLCRRLIFRDYPGSCVHRQHRALGACLLSAVRSPGSQIWHTAFKGSSLICSSRGVKKETHLHPRHAPPAARDLRPRHLILGPDRLSRNDEICRFSTSITPPGQISKGIKLCLI